MKKIIIVVFVVVVVVVDIHIYLESFTGLSDLVPEIAVATLLLLLLLLLLLQRGLPEFVARGNVGDMIDDSTL